MHIDHGNVRNDRKYRVCLNKFAIACSTHRIVLKRQAASENNNCKYLTTVTRKA